MNLQSHNMHLTHSEKHWLPWLGSTGKLAMSWSCFLNRSRYPAVEKTFEGIANTREKILIQWASFKWEVLEKLAVEAGRCIEDDGQLSELLNEALNTLGEFTELAFVSPEGRVMASTYATHTGQMTEQPKALQCGLNQQFLHGPYVDPVTLSIGASTSKFHDEVTLMFYQPIKKDGQSVGCLCGRVPNDVMSDLIQREAGHVFPESGDNYIFMVESIFDPSIKPGVALSRSRFEDDSFTGGENLKGGVKTEYGVVSIQRHTEFEIIFTDPATNQLHPGVRETIKNGQNLYVAYPGYSDYRHIPVIGAGVTFQLPGSPDRWGMMCEGDLEEVYWYRSINYKFFRSLLTLGAGALGGTILSSLHFGLDDITTIAVGTTLGFLVLLLVYFTQMYPFARRLQAVADCFLDVAERSAPLSTRVENQDWPVDQAGEVARWMNSFLDRTESTSNTLISVAGSVSTATDDLSNQTQSAMASSLDQRNAAVSAASQVEQMIENISAVADQTEQTKQVSQQASTLAREGMGIMADLAARMSNMSKSIVDTSERMLQLEERSKSISAILKVISEIAEQTNLLALNATIEAARAGEHGRGFAVVADEVKKLSERTTKSTTEITQMIGAILTETSQVAETMKSCNQQFQEGDTLMGKAASSLTEINNGADQASGMVQDIARLTQEQSHASTLIKDNMASITSTSDQAAQTANNAADAAHLLAIMGSSLSDAAKKVSI